MHLPRTCSRNFRKLWKIYVNQVCYKFQWMAQVLIEHSMMNYANIVKERSYPVWLTLVAVACTLFTGHWKRVTATEWNLKGILKSIYTLLHDTPARRADYISITECDKFPFAYCATCWVKDKKVVDWVVEIWPNIKNSIWEVEKACNQQKIQRKKNIRQFLQLSKINLPHQNWIICHSMPWFCRLFWPSIRVMIHLCLSSMIMSQVW